MSAKITLQPCLAATNCFAFLGRVCRETRKLKKCCSSRKFSTLEKSLWSFFILSVLRFPPLCLVSYLFFSIHCFLPLISFLPSFLLRPLTFPSTTISFSINLFLFFPLLSHSPHSKFPLFPSLSHFFF